MKQQQIPKKQIKPQKAPSIKRKPMIPKYEKNDQTKIAIVQGGAWGDNINSTLMLKPLKNKFENSIIDIHTSTLYASPFYNNSYINKIFEHQADNKPDAINLGLLIPPLLSDSNYDFILSPHPIFNGDKWSCIKHQEWGENLIFAWVRALEDIDVDYGDELETILCLTNEEINKVESLMKNFKSDTRFKNIMEITGESGQTFWNHKWTEKVLNQLARKNEIIFLSNREKTGDLCSLQDKYPNNIIFIGDLSLRECAGVFNYCDRFFSVSSGLSNACNTNYCKKDIQWIEVVNSVTCSSKAIRSTGKEFWHLNDLNAFLEHI